MQGGRLMSDTVLVEKEKKSFGAKVLSKGAMIFSSAWIAVLTLLKGFGYIHLDENEIITSGIAITAVWTPTFINMTTDKITESIGLSRGEN